MTIVFVIAYGFVAWSVLGSPSSTAVLGLVVCAVAFCFVWDEFLDAAFSPWLSPMRSTASDYSLLQISNGKVTQRWSKVGLSLLQSYFRFLPLLGMGVAFGTLDSRLWVALALVAVAPVSTRYELQKKAWQDRQRGVPTLDERKAKLEDERQSILATARAVVSQKRLDRGNAEV